MTEKIDVFAFGVVVLETLAGRPNFDNTLDEDKIYILEWVSLIALNSGNQALISVVFGKIVSKKYAGIFTCPYGCVSWSYLIFTASMFPGVATVRGKAPAGDARPEARRGQHRRGAPCHPRGPPLHPGLAAPASVHVAGRVDAHGRRRDRGGGEQAQLHHRVADQGRQ
jgi:hypothetical protein